MKPALAFVLLLPHAAFAATQPVTLVDRTFQIRVDGTAVHCSEPLPPNGHNYPIYTSLTFGLDKYSLYFGNVWSEVDRYDLQMPNYEPCSTYANLTAPGSRVGTLHQKVTESYGLTNGEKRDCTRITREENDLTVDGVSFQGVNEFLVGPFDAKLCAE